MAGNVAGGIVSRRRETTVRPEVRLPIVMRGAEDLFRFLMDTAANAERYSLEYAENSEKILQELRAIHETLRKAVQIFPEQPVREKNP